MGLGIFTVALGALYFCCVSYSRDVAETWVINNPNWLYFPQQLPSLSRSFIFIF